MTFPIIPGGSPSTSYQISRSLRFRSFASAYLSRTPASAGNRKTWTWSGWVKRGAISGSATYDIFSGDNGSTSFTGIRIINNVLYLQDFATGTKNIWWETTAVFRDPSAWYHIVVKYDTTQASSTNSVLIYVNGVSQVLTFTASTGAYVQNYDGIVNSTSAHKIGEKASTSYFDGYLAEVNFIDGQALTPSSFGAYDTTTGVWGPKKYTGTYGTNGFYLPFSATPTSTYTGAFDGSTQYLTVADNAALEFGSSNFCVEAWVNYTSISGSGNYLLGKVADATSAIASWLIYRGSANGTLTFYASSNGTSYDISNTAFGTLTAGTWNHIAVYRSGNNFYGALNGVVTSLGTSASSIFNNTSATSIGAAANGGAKAASSLSNVRIVTGSSVYSSSNFVPPSSPLTAITGTQLLTLQSSTVVDNSSNAFTITNNGTVATSIGYPFINSFGSDFSGQGNSWFTNNISAATGATYDSMIDSPTPYADGGNGRGNYATLNPLDAGLAPTDGNLTLPSAGSLWRTTRATISIPESAKVYWEITVNGTTSNNMEFGVDVNSSLTTYLGAGANGWTFEPPNTSGSTSARKGNSNTFSSVTLPSAATSNDTYMFAVDRSANSIWVGINGSWVGSVGVSGALFTTLPSTGVLFPASCNYNQASYINFGQRPFTYTPPSGYSALNTQNLPTPTIKNGAQYMAAVTYTGTGSNPRTISTSSTNSGNNPLGTTFQPDFVWIKPRNTTFRNRLQNSVAGANKLLISDLSDAEYTNEANGYVSAFTTDGFTVAAGSSSDDGVNNTNDTYIAWQWSAGGAPTVDNSAGAGNVPTSGSVKINGANSTSALAGSIAASRLSANQSAGFSIVQFTATGSNATVAHGLGVAPSLVIVKDAASAGNWAVWHTSLTSGSYYLFLNTSAAQANTSSIFTAAPSSSVVSIGTWHTADRQIMYCFAPIAGHSAMGSYSGNSSSDGSYIHLGFRARYLLIKNISNGTTDWYIYDTSRNTYNVTNSPLNANLSGAELTGGDLDILSNGFKLRASATATNKTGDTYIYFAVAENPFAYARAR